MVDFSYTPEGNNTLQPHSPLVKVSTSKLYDFNFTVHIRIPVRERWEPYGIAGAGCLYSTYHVASIYSTGTATVYKGATDANFGFETGAGVRYFVEHNWGVRSEWRYTIGPKNISRFVAGLFYQFG
jgi:opacity protein-like surface antigen